MRDNFSGQAAGYAKYRPGYPAALFNFILAHVHPREFAWDCATGNGQTAKELAPYFKKVFATDISSRQLEHAVRAPHIIYSLQPAEKTNFSDNSFDLVTVSQALHWLHFDPFYAEVNRVLKSGGWFAAWMYDLPTVAPPIDEWVRHFYRDVIGTYWDPQRKYVEDHYNSIPFPFEELSCPLFYIQARWTCPDFAGYIKTWSAVRKFIRARGYDPVEALMQQVRPLWQGEQMDIIFPVYTRMGQLHK